MSFTLLWVILPIPSISRLGLARLSLISQLSSAWWFGFLLEFWIESIACFRWIFVQILLKFYIVISMLGPSLSRCSGLRPGLPLFWRARARYFENSSDSISGLCSTFWDGPRKYCCMYLVNNRRLSNFARLFEKSLSSRSARVHLFKTLSITTFL